MTWWTLRRQLAVRELADLLARTHPQAPYRWALAAWLDILTLHIPDRNGRCAGCRRGPGWSRRRHCRLIGALHTARLFDGSTTDPSTRGPARG